MNQDVLIFFFRNICPEFFSSGELCEFEPQDNKIVKIIKFKPFSIYPDNFKSIYFIVIENLRAQKVP